MIAYKKVGRTVFRMNPWRENSHAHANPLQVPQ